MTDAERERYAEIVELRNALIVPGADTRSIDFLIGLCKRQDDLIVKVFRWAFAPSVPTDSPTWLKGYIASRKEVQEMFDD